MEGSRAGDEEDSTNSTTPAIQPDASKSTTLKRLTTQAGKVSTIVGKVSRDQSSEFFRLHHNIKNSISCGASGLEWLMTAVRWDRLTGSQRQTHLQLINLQISMLTLFFPPSMPTMPSPLSRLCSRTRSSEGRRINNRSPKQSVFYSLTSRESLYYDSIFILRIDCRNE